MNKKRGVLISTVNHPHTISKSKSAHTHPLPPHLPSPDTYNQHPIATAGPQQLTQSNLLSEQPERLVNHAYYTYQDPDSMPHHQSDAEENEEMIIESMQKRQEQLIRQLREQEKARIPDKNKNSPNKISNKNKQMSLNKIKPSTAQARRITKPKEPQNKQKQELKVQCQSKRQKKQLNMAIFKPKPLVFSVNMFAKGNISPRSQKNQQQIITKLSQRIQQKTSRGYHQESSWQQPSSGQNLNCKKLPFRFSGVI